ncbi:MAG: double zinc ribbon domain-containing protein [Candidatus Gastranaerophilaceae bacterium]|jgi:ribosomal protein L40E|nr:zinc ribbon domain-containing protein [Christensenellales bacterium]
MSDLLSGLGGLMKGLSGFMPQDDPNVQLMSAQTELSNLKKQEAELYAEIGKRAAEQYGLDSFGELSDRIKLVQANIAAALTKLQGLQGEKDAKEKAEKEALEGRTCPECGHRNPEGVKFCQECGAKVGVRKNNCQSCGAVNPAGVKFCQECGSKLDGGRGAICPSCSLENPLGTRFCGECGARLE